MSEEISKYELFNKYEEAIKILKLYLSGLAIDGTQDAIRTAISALEEKLNNNWIACSEKLPSSDGRFEVTIKGSKGKRYVEMCNFYKDAEIYKWGGKYNSFNVIAWRSRPEPYSVEI